MREKQSVCVFYFLTQILCLVLNTDLLAYIKNQNFKFKNIFLSFNK